jgi:N-methylhydantoinase A
MVVPFGAGVTSAVGFLTAPLAFDFVRTWPARVDSLNWQKANALLAEMETEGRALLESSGLSPERVRYRREADMRYVGQGHEIRVPLPPGRLDDASVPVLISSFEEVYRRLYERLSQAVPVEIINWRVTAAGPSPTVRLNMPAAGHATAQEARKGSREAYLPELGGFHSVAVYDRYRLLPGVHFNGPAIVEERESTVIVGPGSRCRIDDQWNLIVDLQHPPGSLSEIEQ